MIEFLSVINVKENKCFHVDFNKKTLIFSSKNSHGKTFLINFLLWALNQETIFSRKDKIDVRDYVIVLSLNNSIFIRNNKSYYICENNNLIIVDKKQYNMKIISNLNLENLPFIQDKNGYYTNEYLNCFFTFFYVDPDCSGDNSKQLKCQMYGKSNLKNYFNLLLNSDPEILIVNSELAKIINSEENIKDKKNSIKILKKILLKLDKNHISKISIINDEEIAEIKNKIKSEISKKYSLLKDIDALNIENTNLLNMIEPLEKIDKELDSISAKYYFYIEHNNVHEEIVQEVKLSDFYKEYKSSKLLEVSKINDQINENKEKLKLLNTEIDKTKTNINNYKLELDSCLSRSNLIEPLTDYLVYDLLEIKPSVVKEILESELKNVNIIEDLNKKITSFNKIQNSIYNKKMNEFEKKHNFIGQKNSKKFKEQFLRYKLLSKKYKNMFLIIDAYDSLGFDKDKYLYLIETIDDDNQKIVTLTAENDLKKMFEDKGYVVIDISDEKYNIKIVNDDLSELNLKKKKIYDLLIEGGFINVK